jgi:transposase InsO family protein
LTGQGISTKTACHVLRVTERGYRAWRDRPASQRTLRHQMLAETVANIHRASRGCYGIRRVHAELVHGLGIPVGRDQVARVMQDTGLRGLSGTRKRYVNREHLITTEDLVNRNFTATAADQLWCTDIERHEAFLNLAVVKGHRSAPVAAGV